MKHALTSVIERQDRGQAAGICSICSSHPFVLETAMKQALEDGCTLLIESTSNQVNQCGGYAGLTPAQFVEYVSGLAARTNFPSHRLILGGDHLGPNAWREQKASDAMSKAEGLIRAYVQAGFAKIHLDTSMRCGDDPGDPATPFADEVVADRAAALCRVAENTAAEGGGSVLPIYVIGTDVPIPGGARERLDVQQVTSPEAAEHTIRVTRETFMRNGLEPAWRRVVALVVQPGVDFGGGAVIRYESAKAAALTTLIERHKGLVYEAHSTDYQMRSDLRRMVRDHFAILKVGPALTFAFREAVFALSAMENEYLAGKKGHNCSNLPAVLERVMCANPEHWEKHYRGDPHEQAFERKYSYSDRSRYYWPEPDVRDALNGLVANLTENPPPETLLSQFLPRQYHELRAGRISNTPEDLIQNRIQEVITDYAYACGIQTRARGR